MSVLNLISTAAATAEAATHEATINDAVHNLVEHPEETVSKFSEFFHNMWHAIVRAVPTIILAIIVLIVGLIVCKLVLKLISKGLDRTRLDLTVTNFTKQCCKIVLYVLLITVVLSTLGIPATSIVTVIGTAGVAIGLALQNSLSNVAGGIMLMINKPFKIGDYISVAGVSGTVRQITILYTRLDSDSNQAIFIPNGQVSGCYEQQQQRYPPRGYGVLNKLRRRFREGAAGYFRGAEAQRKDTEGSRAYRQNAGACGKLDKHRSTSVVQLRRLLERVLPDYGGYPRSVYSGGNFDPVRPARRARCQGMITGEQMVYVCSFLYIF